MNRFLSLIVAILCSSIVFAQTDNIPFQKIRLADDHVSKASVKSNSQTRQTRDETIFWSCDFENNNYTLVEGNDEANGKDHWQIVTLATFPSELITSSGAYFQPFIYRGDTLNDTPEHWAMVDLLCDHAQFGGTGQVAEKAWIQFQMNLSSTTCPKICFKQLYRPLNSVSSHIKVSVDGGVSWTDHLINDEVASNDYGPLNKEVIIQEAAGRSNVTIRFQQEATGAGLQGYGWQIDDIKIVNVPDHNLTINDARISMFGYFDFRNVPENYWTNMTDSAKRAYAYQLYDPYAQTPAANWNTQNGYAAFNVEYTNNGRYTVSPRVNIVVTSPSGTDIYNKTLTGSSITMTQRDTIDFGTIDDNNMANSTILYFENEPELGRYTVTFTISENGAEDADTSDNTIVQYFDITDGTYSKSYDEPTSRFSAKGYQTSASGDMYGAKFTYYYSPDDIMTADLYIAEGTTPGTQVKVCLYHYDENGGDDGNGGYVLDRESEWLEITEENIGRWNNFVFTNEYNFQFSEDEQYREVTVMAVAAWDNDDDDIYFGQSNVLTSKYHSSMMHLISDEENWFYGSHDIALKFRPQGTTEYTINALPSNENRGYVTGGGTYREGTTITLRATPYEGYRFVSWNDGNTSNPRTITVTGDATYIATFEALPTYTITAESANSNMGTVTGGGTYYEGTVATISATPFNGYRFVSWNDGNTINPRTITVTEDATYTAYFEGVPCTITVLSNNDEFGYVTGGGEHPYGTQTTISATPYEGYRFVSWNDDNTENPRTITVTGNATYIASFENGVTHTITVLSSNPNYGSVEGSGTYSEGSQIQISATANQGYHFTTWNDGNTDNPRTITVTEDATYIASFAESVNMYTITVLPSNPNFGSTTGGGTYLEGSQIEISATANEGYHFTAWNDGNTSNPRTITVTGDATYMANFETNPSYTITVVSENEAYGTVSGSGTYEYGSTVTIRAIPANGYVFTSWNDNNTENPRTITVTGDATYIAYFSDISTVTTYTITVISANEEQGTVVGSGMYAEGTIITIAAIAQNGFRFSSWNDNNTDNPRSITVTGNATYIASFEAIPTYTITVLSGNDEFGTVSGSGTYPEGSVVTISATPAPRYVFVQWNDGNNENPRQITVTENATYIATFNRGNGIEDNIIPEISVFPNPTSSTLYVTSSETISSIEIVNITGQIVSHLDLCNDNVACDVENLTAGMYFIKIRCQSLNGEEGLPIIKKFVKE